MADYYTRFIRTCREFGETINNTETGAQSYENDGLVEEKILKLKHLENFIDSKLQDVLAKMYAGNDQQVEIPELKKKKLKQMKDDLLDELVRNQIGNKLVCVVILLGNIKKLCNTVISDNNELDTYQTSLGKQWRNLETISDEIKTTVVKQKMLVEETIYTQMQLKKLEPQFKQDLIKRKEQLVDEEKQKNTETYNKKLEMLEMRIKKMNFMRLLTSRLICFGDIDFESKPEFINFIESLRKPIEMSDFKDDDECL